MSEHSEASVVEQGEINVLRDQIRDRRPPLGFIPVLSVGSQIIIGEPDDVKFIDFIPCGCKRKRGLFHFVQGCIATLPEGQRIPVCTQVYGYSIGWNFAVGKALLGFPLGTCDFASQEHRLLPEVVDDIADVVLKPCHQFRMGLENVDKNLVLPRFRRLHRGVSDLHIFHRQPVVYKLGAP